MLRHAAAVFLLALTATTAHADDAAMSRFHYEQATRHYEAGRIDRAVQEFFLAQRASPNPRTVYNIGLCFLRLSRPADAFFFLSEYLGLEDEAEGAEARHAFARTSLEELARRVARVNVVSDPPSAEIFVDQREHGTWGRAPRSLALSPGEHRVWVELPGHRRAETTVVAVLGEEVAVALRPERIVGVLEIASEVPATVRVFDATGARLAEDQTPLRVAAAPGRVELEVEAEGHRPQRRFVELVADETASVSLALEPLPPPTGDLTITANVASAVVSLDGERIGLAPIVLPELSLGEHRIDVVAPGHLPRVDVLEVRAEERAWLTLDLASEPRGRSPATWAIGAVGVASSIAATATGTIARRRADAFRERWNEAGRGSVVELRAEANRFARTTDALIGVALLSFASSVLLYFLTGDDEDAVSSSSLTRRPR